MADIPLFDMPGDTKMTAADEADRRIIPYNGYGRKVKVAPVCMPWEASGSIRADRRVR
jgi:hypothetical protein